MERSLRLPSVQKKLAAKTSQITATIILIGQISSAYSLPRVKPAGRVTAAQTMMNCQPQKLILLSRSEAMRTRKSRCVE